MGSRMRRSSPAFSRVRIHSRRSVYGTCGSFLRRDTPPLTHSKLFKVRDLAEGYHLKYLKHKGYSESIQIQRTYAHASDPGQVRNSSLSPISIVWVLNPTT